MTHELLDLNGVRLFVRDEGRGRPVVFLHGFPDTGELWRNQVPALVDAGFRVIVPDLRGRGRSSRPEDVAAYRLSAIVKDVVAILDTKSIDRAHLVGHDWGAAVAWLCAALMPDRVDHLVALSVGAPGATPRPTLEELQKGWYRILILFQGVSEDLLRRDDWFLLRTMLHGAADTERYITELAKPGALTAGLNWYRANLALDSLVARQTRLPKVQSPTLGIWSTGDVYLTEEAMTQSRDRVAGDFRYERVDGSHWIPIDQAERLNRTLLQFLR